jgi:hypothetical protein
MLQQFRSLGKKKRKARLSEVLEFAWKVDAQKRTALPNEVVGRRRLLPSAPDQMIQVKVMWVEHVVDPKKANERNTRLLREGLHRNRVWRLYGVLSGYIT